MSRAAAQGWAAVIGAGALLAAFAGRESVDAGRAIDLFWYVVLCGLVYRWGAAIYGPVAALGATALVAWSPEVLAGAAGLRAGMAAAACAVAAIYAAAHCLWDPGIQVAVLAGLAMGAALLSDDTLPVLLPFSVLLVGLRVVTAERMEPRRRVAHGAAAAVLIIWAIALLLLSAARPFRAAGAPMQDGFSGIGLATLFAHGPLVLLFLVRRWGWEHRYSDGTLVLAVACLLLATPALDGRQWVLPIPFAALLAAGAWDHARSRRAQGAAWFLVGVQALAALALWPGNR